MILLRSIIKAHVRDYDRVSKTGAIEHIRAHEDNRVRAYGRKIAGSRDSYDLHQLRRDRFGHLPHWNSLDEHTRQTILDAEEEKAKGHKRFEDWKEKVHGKKKEAEKVDRSGWEQQLMFKSGLWLLRKSKHDVHAEARDGHGRWVRIGEHLMRHVESMEEARAAALELKGKPIENINNHVVATVSRNNIDKMCSNSAISKSVSRKAHAMALANLDTLFRHSEERENKPDRDNDLNIKAIGRYYAPMTYNGEHLEVKMTVKYFHHHYGNSIYSVEAMEITRPAGQLADTDIAKSNRCQAPIAGLVTENIPPTRNKLKKSHNPLHLVRRRGC